MASTHIVDYLGSGTAAAMPTSPPSGVPGTAFYYQTDTGVMMAWTGSAWVGLPIPAGSRPAGSSFSWINQGTATLHDIPGGPLVIRDGNNAAGSYDWRILAKTVPGTDFTLAAQIGVQGFNPGNDVIFGLVAYNSATGAFFSFGPLFQSAGNICYIYQWTNVTTPNSAAVSGYYYFTNPVWLKLQYVQSTATFTAYQSIDGLDWDELGSTTVAAFLGGLTHVGFGFDAKGLTTAGQSESVRLYNWSGV